jgi:two-component system, OmpR family, KDP operon response regulator KdpE
MINLKLMNPKRRTPMPRPRILLVDDDPDLLRALRLRLRANNYEVTTASDGYAAIAAAQKERPALIILDLGLPVGDGFVVLNRLQNSDALSGVPVIVLSARDPQNNEEKALKAGAAAFFQKPADNDELLNVIRVSLGPGAATTAAPWPS